MSGINIAYHCTDSIHVDDFPMKVNLKLKTLVGLACLSLSTLAQASNILDFEGFANGQIIDDEYVSSQGVTIRGFNVDRGVDNMAVIFDTDLSNTADPDLEAPFFDKIGHGLGSINPGNVLIIHEHPSECNWTVGSCGPNPDDEGSQPAGYFDLVFDREVTLNSIDFFDVEYGENGNSYRNKITVLGSGTYDPFYTPWTDGDNGWTRLDFNLVGVTSLRIKVHGSGAIDNINFTDVSVPAPPVISLLALGLASLLMTRRRRIRAATA